jgi:type II secretory pathway component HofQ
MRTKSEKKVEEETKHQQLINRLLDNDKNNLLVKEVTTDTENKKKEEATIPANTTCSRTAAATPRGSQVAWSTTTLCRWLAVRGQPFRMYGSTNNNNYNQKIFRNLFKNTNKKFFN